MDLGVVQLKISKTEIDWMLWLCYAIEKLKLLSFSLKLPELRRCIFTLGQKGVICGYRSKHVTVLFRVSLETRQIVGKWWLTSRGSVGS